MKKRMEKWLGGAACLAVALIYVTVALQAQDRPLPSEIEATRAEVGDTSAAARAHADSVAGDSAQAAEARAKAAAADSAAAAVSAHEAAIGHVDTSFVRTTAGDSGQAAEARAKAAAGDSALAALNQGRSEMPDSALAAFALEIIKYIRIAGDDSTVIDSMLHLLNGMRVTGYARFDSILNGTVHLWTTPGDSGLVVYSLGGGRYGHKVDEVDTSGVAGQIDSLATASAAQDSVIKAKAQADSTFLDSLARAGITKADRDSIRIDSLDLSVSSGDTWLSSLTLPDSSGRGQKDSMIIGETVTFATPLYMKSDGKLWKADNDTSITLPARYISLEGGNANDTIAVLISGKIKCSGWTFSAGDWLIVSNTAGQLKATAVASGEWQQYVGQIGPVDVLEWRPDYLPVLKK